MAASQNDWAERLRVIAAEGLAASASLANDEHNFDRERYQQVLALADRIEKELPGPSEPLRLPETAPQTPKTGVRGAAFRDGQLLLIRHCESGLWSLPGGFADAEDTPTQMIVREFAEETGFAIRPSKLFAVYARNSHPHAYSPNEFHMFFFICEIISGAWQPNQETCDLGFFAEEALPPLDPMTVTPYQISRCFAHARHALLPTEFD